MAEALLLVRCEIEMEIWVGFPKGRTRKFGDVELRITEQEDYYIFNHEIL
jgi:hypothetical protein